MKKSNCKIRNIIVLLLGAVLLSPLLITNGIAINIDADQESIMTQGQPEQDPGMNKYPVDYTIVDEYYNGETVVRETRNSLDTIDPSVISQQTLPPLLDDQTSLLGGEEIAVLLQSSGERINHFEDTDDWNANDLDDLRKSVSLVGPSSVRYSELACGDFDGNFKEDIVIASIPDLASPRLRIQIMENWGDEGLTLTADSGLSGMWDCDKILTVLAGDFDGDTIDEFAVLGLNGSQPLIWIFDDIMNSIQPQVVRYGDNITIKTSTSPNHYLRDLAGFVGNYEMTESTVATDLYSRFYIHKADDRSCTDVVQYGDEIMLYDQFGEIVGDEVYNAVIRSDRGNNNNETGVVLYNHFFTIDQDNPIPVHWPFYKILKSGQVPRTFQGGLEPIETISNIDYVIMDISATAFADHSTKGIASGNFDNDPYEELVLVGMDASGWARAWIYDDAVNNFDLLEEISWVSVIQDIHPNVAVGDVDEDPQDEIIISLTNAVSGRIQIYDDGFGSEPFALLDTLTSTGSLLYGEISTLTTGDVDGDGYDEIVFSNYTSDISVWDDMIGNFEYLYHWKGILDVSPFPSQPLEVQCGDVDIDGADEILYVAYFQSISGEVTELSVWDFNTTSATKLDNFELLNSYQMNVVTGDFAADHITLRYLDRDVYTSDEQIIAVMAAPPTQAGISQNYEDSSTTFGEGTSSTGSQEWGFSASFGVYWGTETEVTAGFLVSVNIAKFETENAIVAAAEIQYTVETSTAYMHTFTSDAYHDYVIFSACLYDRFLYEVLDAPDPTMIGTNYSIHIPNTPSIEKWDREYYNSHNSEYAHDIGQETFNHTIGFLTTYPDKEEMETLAPNRLETGTVSVGKGGGTISQQIDLTVVEEVELEASLTYEYKIGGGASSAKGGIMGSVGILGGHHWGWGEETMFSCDIGDIEDDNDYERFRYSCGLFIHVVEYVPVRLIEFLSHWDDIGIPLERITTLGLDRFSRGEGYYVLNYWVETPLGWAEGAAEIYEYSNDLVELLSNLSALAPFVFYPAVAAIPIANLLYLWRRRRLTE